MVRQAQGGHLLPIAKVQRLEAVEEGGKTLGETYDDYLALRQDPHALRTRTIIRTSEMCGTIVAMNTEIKAIDDLDDIDLSRESRWKRGDVPNMGPGRGALMSLGLDKLLDPSYMGAWADVWEDDDAVEGETSA